MRKTMAFFFVCALFFPSCAFAEVKGPPPEIKGLEWLEMPISSRMEAVLPAMATLEKNGVFTDKTPNDCYNLIQDFLNLHPNYYDATMTQVLAQALYEKDPKVREALDRLRKKPA